MLCAVVPLVCGERLAGLRRRVVDELVALALRHLAGFHRPSAAGRLPRLAAVARTLDHLSEPAAGLRRVQPVRVGGRALHVIDLPAGKVRAAHVPLFALPVRCEDEGPLARTNQYPYPAHASLLSACACAFGRRRGRRTSSAADTAVPTCSVGCLDTPNTQCIHAPATIATGRRSMAQAAHWGRKARDPTPRRITADNVQVPRCTSSRRARSARTPCRDTSSALSDAVCAMIIQMPSTASRSAVVGSRSNPQECSSRSSCVASGSGRSEPGTAARRAVWGTLGRAGCSVFTSDGSAVVVSCRLILYGRSEEFKTDTLPPARISCWCSAPERRSGQPRLHSGASSSKSEPERARGLNSFP